VNYRICKTVLLLAGVFLASTNVYSASPEVENDAAIQGANEGTSSNKSPSCPDAEVFGQKIITAVCWDCIFPISVAGNLLRVGDSDKQQPPEDATNDIACACPLSPNDPIPVPGLTVSYWEPAKLVEMVRTPFCLPSLAGTKVQDTWRGMGGHGSTPKASQTGVTTSAFYNGHYLSFPLFSLLNMMPYAPCNPDGYFDVAIQYMTEFDPTWNNDELALIVSFETLIFANPASLAACGVDATLATVHGRPSNSLFWCAGTWGGMYPSTGNVLANHGMINATSLASARMISKLHRIGMARQYVGDNAMCEAPYAPTIHKTQYKLSTFFPVVEAKQNHWIGEHVFRWGLGRSMPASGEDAVYLMYRFRDCCFRVLP
jgi:conjugal transfer pilus assembly protein TraU